MICKEDYFYRGKLLKHICLNTREKFCVRSNKTAVARNKAIDRENSSARPIPLEWKFYAKTYEYTHAGIYKARGEGKRSRQESRALDCKAQFNLCGRCNGQNGEFTLCVTKTTLVHNHALSL
ncbi:hypothetical protein F442_18539, partial [Phytophthora nicotianae P10297]